MARIRTIKPEFWTSEQVVECSRDARLLFIGLWTFCDDGGVHPASAKRIKMEIFPGDDLTGNEILRLVDELIRNGLVEVFEAQGQEYWHVVSWDKHQKIEKKSYRFPKFAEHSTTVRRPVDDRSTTERKETEGSGTERNGTEEESTKPFSPNSAFAELTPEIVADPEQVLGWLDRQQAKKRPVVGDSEAEIINVLAAAYQVTQSESAANKPAVFGSIVSERKWGTLSNKSVDRATKQLRAIEAKGRPPPGSGFAANGIPTPSFTLDGTDDRSFAEETADAAR